MKNIINIVIGLLMVTALKAQTLDSYIQEAENNNPEVQAFELRYNISKEKVEEADAFPKTEVNAGVFVSEPETRTGAQKARFSVKQMLPWFGYYYIAGKLCKFSGRSRLFGHCDYQKKIAIISITILL